jgi:hypothetical protein
MYKPKFCDSSGTVFHLDTYHAARRRTTTGGGSFSMSAAGPDCTRCASSQYVYLGRKLIHSGRICYRFLSSQAAI